MPSKKGGYKIVSLGGLDLTGENLSLKGLYNALKISYGKPIQLCGIIIDGEAKKDALVQADEGANVINIKHLYGYNLSVSSADAITVIEDSEGIELPVPTPEDDGMIVGVNVQGKYVLKPAPSGGAKLYRHMLQLKEQESDPDYRTTTIYLINTNSRQITFSDLLLILQNISAYEGFYSNDVRFMGFFDARGNSLILKSTGTSIGIITPTESSGDIIWSMPTVYSYLFSDTIIEL